MPPEAWLRGPVPHIPASLMPAAHALVQAREDFQRAAADVSNPELWLSPGGAASAGFHLRHIAGSIDRLLTYARGEQLNDHQREALRAETTANPTTGVAVLLREAEVAVERALDFLRGVDESTLQMPRAVGRAGLPSTVFGLLFHIAEHTQRHTGQLITTVKIVRGLGLGRALDLD